MTDITHDLWTVRDALAKAGDSEGLAAIGRISEELARLREVHAHAERLLENPDYRNVLLTDENDRLRAERDEAVAALREALTDVRVMGHLQLQTFKMADDVLARIADEATIAELRATLAEAMENYPGEVRPLAPPARFEAELTRLREERDSLDVQVRAALRYTDALRAERDDAVAALRLTMRFIAETHLEGRGA